MQRCVSVSLNIACTFCGSFFPIACLFCPILLLLLLLLLSVCFLMRERERKGVNLSRWGGSGRGWEKRNKI